MEKVKGVLLLERADMSDVPPAPPRTVAPPPSSAPLGSSWTAPSVGSPPLPPGMPEPATSLPVSRPVPATPDLVVVLDKLTASVAGAYGAILASVDGFSIARSSTVVNQASHSAMLAAAVGLAHQLVAMGGGSELRQLVVEHDSGLLLIWPIGKQRVLAVLTAALIDQRLLRDFVQSNVELFRDGKS